MRLFDIFKKSKKRSEEAERYELLGSLDSRLRRLRDRKLEGLMLSQLAALWVVTRDPYFKESYIRRVTALKVSEKEAVAVFDFDCGVFRKYRRNYLLNDRFTDMWFFGLRQKFFKNYPGTKTEILNERFLTISELCKLVDEAEWHFWNSHERDMSELIWGEICVWRINGPGGEFAVRYFGMIADRTGVAMDSLAKISSSQGEHLSRHKWK